MFVTPENIKLKFDLKIKGKVKVEVYVIDAQNLSGQLYHTGPWTCCEKNPLPGDTGPVQHPGYQSLTFPGFPRYSFLNQAKKENDQLGNHTDSPG